MVSLTTLALAGGISAVLAALLIRLPGPKAVPVADRWHDVATPMSGGFAIVGAFMIALQQPLASGAVQGRYLPLMVGAFAAFGVGFWDDRHALGELKKFAAQLAVAFGAAVAGVRPDWLPIWLSIPAAAFVLVSCTNAFNFLDNIDGLSAGTAAIAATGLALVGGLVPGSGSPVVAAALAGACLGFLPFNYWPRRPAAIFLGDSGSHMLGFTIGALALLASPGGAGGVVAALAAPLLILAVPILDTALVVAVRFAEGRPVYKGGCDHTSHRLVYHGLSDRRAVAVLLGITANCTISAIALVILHDLLLTAVAAGMTLAALIGFAARLALIHEEPRAAPTVFEEAPQPAQEMHAAVH